MLSCGKGKINIKLFGRLNSIENSTVQSALASWNGFGGVANDVVIRGNYAYVAKGLKGLEVYNISDLLNIELIGRYNTAGNAYGVTLSGDGNYAYVADRSNGLMVVDVTDPSNPVLK